jgi:hypothetical protein
LTNFADQLFEDLMREHGAALRDLSDQAPIAAAGTGHKPKRARAARRPAWLTAGLVTATGATAAGFVLFGGAAAPAFAVTQNANGTVSVTVNQASAIDAANTKLKAMGVRVAVVPARPGCPSLSDFAPTHFQGELSISIRKGTSTSIDVDAKDVPASDTLALAYESDHGGLFVSSGLVTGKVPSCVAIPAARTPGSGGPAGRSGHQSGGSSGSGSQGILIKR